MNNGANELEKQNNRRDLEHYLNFAHRVLQNQLRQNQVLGERLNRLRMLEELIVEQMPVLSENASAQKTR